MQIEIDSNSGFCYGVVKTVELAEAALSSGQPVYCLGEIVHNEEEVERLRAKGLTVINHEDLQHIKNATVLVRAHGEPPSTYNQISEGKNMLKEGTCPIVLQLQKKVRDAWAEMQQVNGQIVIYGKKGHAEVVGLCGQTDNKAIVVSSPDDLASVDFTKPVWLFSQTTQPLEGFQTIAALLKDKLSVSFPGQEPLKVTDSICRHVSKRGEHLKVFAQKFDVVIFVCGTHSSNGKVLFEICKKTNPNAYWVPGAEYVQKEWFVDKKSVGIAGATSTPRWLMEQVALKIEEISCS